MLALDKNWYHFPANEQMPITEDYSYYPGLDLTLLGNFPQNVEVTIAQRQAPAGIVCGVFRLLNGLHVYYEIDFVERERTLVPVDNVHEALGWGFELEDIDWKQIPLDPDPVFDHPIFDLNDEV
jgi:hypothetical protein